MAINIIWWESSITDHQLYTLHELSSLKDLTLRVFVLNAESEARKIQGWASSDLSIVNGNIIENFPMMYILRMVWSERRSIHVFGGPFDSWIITIGLFSSLIRGNRTFVLTEPFSPISAGLLKDGVRFILPIITKLRAIKYRVLWTLIRTRVNGVFAISKLAIMQLKMLGVAENKLFPFGYFVPAVTQHPTVFSKNVNDILRIIFVGTINKTKGIDLAVTAVDTLNRGRLKIQLDIFGSGNVESLGLPKLGIAYKGRIQFGNAQTVMSSYDCVILPSRYDGWGVAVNEALLAGVPVICSEQVGASVLVKRWTCGAVYDNNDPNSLMSTLENLFEERGTVLEMWRTNIKEVRNIIMPDSGAKYIADVVMGRAGKNDQRLSSWHY